MESDQVRQRQEVAEAGRHKVDLDHLIIDASFVQSLNHLKFSMIIRNEIVC